MLCLLGTSEPEQGQNEMKRKSNHQIFSGETETPMRKKTLGFNEALHEKKLSLNCIPSEVWYNIMVFCNYKDATIMSSAIPCAFRFTEQFNESSLDQRRCCILESDRVGDPSIYQEYTSKFGAYAMDIKDILGWSNEMSSSMIEYSISSVHKELGIATPIVRELLDSGLFAMAGGFVLKCFVSFINGKLDQCGLSEVDQSFLSGMIEFCLSYGQWNSDCDLFSIGDHSIKDVCSVLKNAFGRHQSSIFDHLKEKNNVNIAQVLEEIPTPAEYGMFTCNRSTINYNSISPKFIQEYRNSDSTLPGRAIGLAEPLQIIYKNCASMDHLLAFFDLDSCKISIMNNRIYITRDFVRCMYSKYNIISPLEKLTTRVYKYASRGIKTLRHVVHPLMYNMFKEDLHSHIKYIEYEAEEFKKSKLFVDDYSNYHLRDKGTILSPSGHFWFTFDLDEFVLMSKDHKRTSLPILHSRILKEKLDNSSKPDFRKLLKHRQELFSREIFELDTMFYNSKKPPVDPEILRHILGTGGGEDHDVAIETVFQKGENDSVGVYYSKNINTLIRDARIEESDNEQDNTLARRNAYHRAQFSIEMCSVCRQYCQLSNYNVMIPKTCDLMQCYLSTIETAFQNSVMFRPKQKMCYKCKTQQR